jgi:hypothetical protein
MLVPVMFAATGCGLFGGSDASAIQLLDRLAPLDVPAAVVVDVAAVRRELGLGAAGGNEDAERRFNGVVGNAYPLLTTPFQSAVRDAIDLGRVTRAVGNGGSGRQAVTVLATDQPFDDVAKALEAGGYKRDGKVLRAPGNSRSMEAGAVAGGKGVIVVGGDAAAVLAAAEGRNGGIKGTVREVADSLKAPAVKVVAPKGACFKAMAAADDLKDRRGRLVVVASGATADKFAKQLQTVGYTLDPPKVDGERVTATLSYEENAATPLRLVGGEVPAKDIYNC